MTPMERFFAAKDAYVKAFDAYYKGRKEDHLSYLDEYAEYLRARDAWDGYDAWRKACKELDE